MAFSLTLSRCPLVCHRALGSALCFFMLYTSNLIKSTQDNFPEISCYCYADDTQLCVSFRPSPSTQDASVSMLEKCVNFIYRWMINNNLKLNDSKSEFWL